MTNTSSNYFQKSGLGHFDSEPPQRSVEAMTAIEKHCPTCICGRRAPVQGEIGRHAKRGPGTITWDEHLRAWSVYAACGHGDQSAERIAERGGFGYDELTRLLGREPQTWEASR